MKIKSTSFDSPSSLIVLIMLGTIWGTGYSIARFAMTHDVPPLGYSFWQSIGPAIIISLILFIKSPLYSLKKSHLLYYFICGLTGIVVPNTCMYYAAPHLPAGTIAMIVNIVPIVVFPMALLAGLEKFDWQRFLGICIALAGLALILFPRSSLPNEEMFPWALFTLLTPVSFALCSIYAARFRPPNLDSLALSAGMLIAASCTLLPIVISANSFYPFHFPFMKPDWIILLEIILSSIGYILFFKLIKMAGPVFYSLVDTIVVLTGLFWGYIIFGERLNFWTFCAVCLIIIALLLVTRRQCINE